LKDRGLKGGILMRIALLLAMAACAFLAGCATITPPSTSTVSEILTPTADFTMRLPPFVSIEVLKNSRIPVIGTTNKGDQTYRVVVLPARAASALRFLIKDDGSFEGSAINYAGSKMGFSYEPVPADVRLVNAATVPVASPLLTDEEQEAVRQALDKHLAQALKDPMSAIQYSASDAVPCRNVANVPSNMRDGLCVCYMVNAKNSMGGFTGAQLAVDSIMGGNGKPFLLLEIPKELIGSADGCANLKMRDSNLIHAQVN
jgi:hypothetical protein